MGAMLDGQSELKARARPVTLYTTNGVSSDVSVIDLDEGRVIKTVGVGRLPWGVVVRP